MIFEVCIDSVEGALAAQAGGAQRVELCDNLVEGGTTPSLGMLQVVRQQVALGVHVIIRPRGGDFCYTAFEHEVMCQDIRNAKAAGADGVVIGLLNPDGTVDIERTRALVDLARPMSVTFHRAFDLSSSPFEALEAIAALGIQRILTSGQKPTALEGLDTIAALVQQSVGRVSILAGGGITAENVAEILRSGVQEIHFSARRVLESPMRYRNPGCFMGKAYQPDEYIRKQTETELVRQIIRAAEE